MVRVGAGSAIMLALFSHFLAMRSCLEGQIRVTRLQDRLVRLFVAGVDVARVLCLFRKMSIEA